MGDVSYKPLIEDFVWSYSRVRSYEDCPYRFFLQYISKCKGIDKFYASYGSFMHKLIERYYKGKLTKEQMLTTFLTEFSKEVKGERPQDGIAQKYIKYGADYLRGFKPFPYNMVAAEKKVKFDVGGIPFIGYIDYLGERDGEYYIVDNKSRNLKPRSGRLRPTAKDKELDLMLKQLYLYSAGIKQEFGKFPKALCFNCFKTGIFIEEPFNEKAYYEAVKWASQIIDDIKDTDDFYPNIDFFSCNYICEVSNDCCYNHTAYGEGK